MNGDIATIEEGEILDPELQAVDDAIKIAKDKLRDIGLLESELAHHFGNALGDVRYSSRLKTAEDYMRIAEGLRKAAIEMREVAEYILKASGRWAGPTLLHYYERNPDDRS